jgi:hypothetical protein
MNLELIPRATSRDVSGFGVFSHGDAGEAHVVAHRMLDEARYELGHRLLGAWLGQHEGAGSDWTHLQWHMAVFEIAVGKWEAPRPVSLAWEPVRDTALRRLTRPSTPYVELHCLLALAGAGDVDGLDRWLHSKPATDDPQARLLAQMGVGLRAFAARDFEIAAAVLATAVPKVSLLGGSHAQNQLFEEIEELSWVRAQALTPAAA